MERSNGPIYALAILAVFGALGAACYADEPQRVQVLVPPEHPIQVPAPHSFRVPEVGTTVYTVTNPETGCEYLLTGAGGITPNVGRDRLGNYHHLGCRLGSMN